MGVRKWIIGMVCVLAGISKTGEIFAQIGDQLNLKLQSSVYLQEKLDESELAPYIKFANINKLPYYKDNRLRREIAHAEKEEDWATLDELLSRYIRNFGIENFNKDAEYLWLAGKAKEEVGDTASALMYYNLGFKNQRTRFTGDLRHGYETLAAPHHNKWVDLEFYYKILEARRKVDTLIPPKGVMLNMGPKVNSEKPDYAPFMHPSDSVLIFTSRRDEEIVIDDIHAQKNENLYYAQKGFISGVWSDAKKFTDAINSSYNEGSACLSPDGKTLYFTRCDEPEGYGSCDIYVAEFYGGTWINIRNLGTNVNSPGWDSHPNISPDGEMLFFTSNREGGFGGSDLYVTFREEDGTWTMAENLGPTVNTKENEVTPFYHKVNGTLFFSSTGHLLNLGGYDIYKSRWLRNHWEEPKNVGPLVNSNGNEYYFSIDGKGSRLFYAMAKNDKSEEVHQDFDLYSFPMPMEARPDAIVTLKGYLMDSVTGNPITGIVLVIDKDQGIEVAPKHINEFGYFEFDLINSHKYDIYIQGDNFFTVKEDIVTSSDTTFSVLVESFHMDKTFVFETLEFEEDSYELNSSIEPKLDYIVTFLKRYPMFKLEVQGHTDSDGEAKYNLELSQKRAFQIRKYLVARADVPEDRISARGFGESRPLVPNNTEAHKRMNRRVEFKVVLDEGYKGELILPMEEEFDLDVEEFYDPEFMEEEFDFDWEDDEDWDEYFDDEDQEDDDLLLEYDDWGLDGVDEDDLDELDEFDDID